MTDHEKEARRKALQHAVDLAPHRGNAEAGKVVQEAKTYLNFLLNSELDLNLDLD